MGAVRRWITGSIRREMIFLPGAALVLTLVVSGLFLGRNVSTTFKKLSDKYLDETTSHYLGKLRTYLQMNTVRAGRFLKQVKLFRTLQARQICLQ